jgi:uncharacterized protein involved in tellurium resistance
MPKLKAKVTLRAKNDASAEMDMQNAKVVMQWTAKDADLDLMCFGKRKDGTDISVFTNKLGGSLGVIDANPFVKHTGDAGVDLGGDVEVEELHIAKANEIESLDVLVMNYTDAVEGKPSDFATYGGDVVVEPDVGESMSIPLNDTKLGDVMVVCKIDGSGAKPKVVNTNDVMSIGEFASRYPGSKPMFE